MPVFQSHGEWLSKIALYCILAVFLSGRATAQAPTTQRIYDQGDVSVVLEEDLLLDTWECMLRATVSQDASVSLWLLNDSSYITRQVFFSTLAAEQGQHHIARFGSNAPRRYAGGSTKSLGLALDDSPTGTISAFMRRDEGHIDGEDVASLSRAEPIRVRFFTPEPYNATYETTSVAGALMATDERCHWTSGPSEPAPFTGLDGMRRAPFQIEGLNRQAVQTVLPQYTEQVNAVVRVRITVAPSGRVTRRIPLIKGNQALEQAVMNALLNWRFNPLPPNEPQEDQTGVVTFRFQLR